MEAIHYNSKNYALANRQDKYLYDKVIQYLTPKENETILEIGCGRGFLTRRIQAIAKETIGIDINPQAISNGVAFKLKVMDATKLDFPDDSFDKIYSCHTIEHIPDVEKAFKEMERVLKPGGKMLLVYPWEMIRGMGAVGASFVIFKNPFHCRRIHLHKLNPEKIKTIIQGSKLKHIESHFSLFKSPQYFTILKKSESQ